MTAKHLRVLLVDEGSERATLLQTALRTAGYTVLVHVDTPENLLTRVLEVEPDVIIIDRDSPDRDTLEYVCAVTRDAPRPIVLFTHDNERASIQAAVKAGVSAYVVGGVSAERIRPIVDVAMARFQEFQTLKRELDQAKSTLAERKLIERAKGIVSKHRGVDEAEAYALLRKSAMDRNQRLVQVAENVIAMAELLA